MKSAWDMRSSAKRIMERAARRKGGRRRRVVRRGVGGAILLVGGRYGACDGVGFVCLIEDYEVIWRMAEESRLLR